MTSKVHSFQSIGFQIGYMAFEVHDFQSKWFKVHGYQSTPLLKYMVIKIHVLQCTSMHIRIKVHGGYKSTQILKYTDLK